jgi:hypothetical protein
LFTPITNDSCVLQGYLSAPQGNLFYQIPFGNDSFSKLVMGVPHHVVIVIYFLLQFLKIDWLEEEAFLAVFFVSELSIFVLIYSFHVTIGRYLLFNWIILHEEVIVDL